MLIKFVDDTLWSGESWVVFNPDLPYPYFVDIKTKVFASRSLAGLVECVTMSGYHMYVMGA